MTIIQLFIFAFAAVVNYFDTKAALWIALVGLVLPIVWGMLGR